MFGPRSETARHRIGTMLPRLIHEFPSLLESWSQRRWMATGIDPDRPTVAHRLLVDAYRLSPAISHRPAALLLALQLYFIQIVRETVANELGGYELDVPFDCSSLIGQNEHKHPSLSFLQPIPDETAIADRFGTLYEHLFPAAVRRHLGEYFTPSWLADRLLMQATETFPHQANIIDPTCGSGAFLLAAVRHFRAQGLEASTILGRLRGYDLNPLAVFTAKANLLLALFRNRHGDKIPGIPVFEHDLLSEQSFPAPLSGPTLVAGNPPWLNWDRLPATYRKAAKSLWEEYGLFNLSINAARHGGAKKELAALMLLRAADRLLNQGDRLAMVLPLSLFRTAQAGEGFRRFHIAPSDIPLSLLRLDDYTRYRLFPYVHTPACTLVLTKGKATGYPVPYFIHHPENIESMQAEPGDPSNRLSPWCIRSMDSKQNRRTFGLSGYRAYLGANAAGASSVYWLEILEKTEHGTLRIRNLATAGKRHAPQVIAEIEPDFVFPLLRWRDIDTFRAVPSTFMLIPQDIEKRVGIDEERLRKTWPLTWEYLKRFESILRDRAAFRKMHGARAPFYSLYNVGPPTFAPIKVVWRRMDNRLRAAVACEEVIPGLGRRPLVPQETCVLIPVRTLREADMLAAKLNSEPVQERIRSISPAGSKSFGSPGILKFL